MKKTSSSFLISFFPIYQVNKASCEFCTYHVNKAYKNISAKRGDLQSAFSGNADVRARIMNKIAPKGLIGFFIR